MQRHTRICADNGVVQSCGHARNSQPTQGLHQSGRQHVGPRLAGHPALAVQVAAPGVERAGLSQRAAVPRPACHLPAEQWLSQLPGIKPSVAWEASGVIHCCRVSRPASAHGYAMRCSCTLEDRSQKEMCVLRSCRQ